MFITIILETVGFFTPHLLIFMRAAVYKFISRHIIHVFEVMSYEMYE